MSTWLAVSVALWFFIVYEKWGKPKESVKNYIAYILITPYVFIYILNNFVCAVRVTIFFCVFDFIHNLRVYTNVRMNNKIEHAIALKR